MAVLGPHPYAGFKFLVDLGDGATDSAQAGFQEVGPITMDVPVIEYRNGNARENSVTKLPGLAKVGDVTLRRGLIGSLNLYQWLRQIADGDSNALRNVTIHLLGDDHAPVMSWRLLRARIVKHTSGPFNAQSNTVAVEEIVLAYERLEIE